MRRIVWLDQPVNGRQARAKVTPVIGSLLNVKLQLKYGPFWYTVDRMVPYSSKDPNMPAADLVNWAIQDLITTTEQQKSREDETWAWLSGEDK